MKSLIYPSTPTTSTNGLSKKLSEQLLDFIPEGAIPKIVDWTLAHKVSIKITPKRKTKLGDYRRPQNGHGHRISINGDLNQYAFLITLVHEFAHLFAFIQFKGNIKPHGYEWQETYKASLNCFLGQGIFPQDIENAIKEHLVSPSASSCVDQKLYKSLRQYNKEVPWQSDLKILENIPEGTYFYIPGDSKMFIKGPLMRKRYRCKEAKTGRAYSVSALVEVFVYEPKK